MKTPKKWCLIRVSKNSFQVATDKAGKEVVGTWSPAPKKVFNVRSVRVIKQPNALIVPKISSDEPRDKRK